MTNKVFNFFLFLLTACILCISVMLLNSDGRLELNIDGLVNPITPGSRVDTLSHVFRICFSFFAALSFWGISIYVTEQTQKETFLPKAKSISRKIHLPEDPSPMFLTLAMSIFAFSSLIKLVVLWFFPSSEFWKEFSGLSRSILSSINSFFILSALLWVRLDKDLDKKDVFVKKITNFYIQKVLKKERRWLSWFGKVTLLLIAATLVIFILEDIVNIKLSFIDPKMPDFLFSILTCTLLGLVLYATFVMRKMPWMAKLSVLMTSITLLSQIVSTFAPQGLSVSFLSLLYSASFVTLMFALEISFLGDTVIGRLTESKMQLEEANENSKKTNKQLENQKQQYQKFHTTGHF